MNAENQDIHRAVIGHKNILVDSLLQQNHHLVYQKDESGNTPLHHAVQNQNLRAIKLLISYGANIQAENALGLTPIMLIENLAPRRSEIQVLFSTVAQKLLEEQIQSKNMTEERLYFLLNNGAKLDVKDYRGLYPYEQAVAVENKDFCYLLLKLQFQKNHYMEKIPKYLVV